MTNRADTAAANNADSPPPATAATRPAIPSGAVRARRIYPRYRKNKARVDAPLQPAAPVPTPPAKSASNKPSSAKSTPTRPDPPKRAQLSSPPSDHHQHEITPTKSTSAHEQPANNENLPPANSPVARSTPEYSDSRELENLAESVAALQASGDVPRARPLICQDINNSNADTLRISRLPRGVTYDRLYSMVEPFGEVDELTWTAADPYVCEVVYRDPSAAREAKHFLGDALAGSDSEPPLKAELRSRDPGAQLFVGDLTPDVTEEMLEAVFSELVGEPVSALLKRDPDSFSPIGYGFLSFQNESSANFALVAGHRVKIGNACVRVGRAERNTHLYVSDLAPNVSIDELKDVFGKFGSLVEEDTIIIRRSYAFIRYRNRASAEKAKRTLDKTELKGRISVRYAEAEPLKACVAVQFHSSVPRPPNSLRDLLSATFSKHGNCSVEIPRLQNGMWRKVAFVTYHGEPIAANLAALEAVQSIRFVSSLPVCCQFARELIPRLPSRGLRFEKASGETEKLENVTVSERPGIRTFSARKGTTRQHEQATDLASARANQPNLDPRGRISESENNGQQGSADFVPVYVPISALQHPMPIAASSGQSPKPEYAGSYPWQLRMMMPHSGHATTQGMHVAHSHGYNPNNSFAPDQERVMRW